MPVLVGCALAVTAVLAMTPTVHAQTPTLVTLTFTLTVNGTPAPSDGFIVTWGETGLTLCNAPCKGGRHVYSQTETFPVGVTETFIFARVFPGHGPGGVGRQVFSNQTVTTRSDRTVGAFFDYGLAPVIQPPPTGGAPAFLLGAAVAGVGVALLGFGLRRRPGRDRTVGDARRGDR